MLTPAPQRRFSTSEVLRMVEVGILAEDEPVELIDGVLIEVAPQGPQHRGLSVVVRDALADAWGHAVHVQSHSPIDAGEDSLPEPDVAVVRGSARDFLDHHPTGADVHLAVEISVTSQALDRAKASIYARAGVATYWNIDVPARRVTVYTDPAGGEYRQTRIHREPDSIPTGGATIPVKSLLP